MNPIILLKVGAAVATLFGIGGTAYGVDQHNKRRSEQAASRKRLQEIEAELVKKEEELILLRERLGDKNEQVRIPVAKVTRLRSAAANLRHSA